MLKATKVRIYPTVEQADLLNQQFGAVRFVYNQSLRIISNRYKKHNESLRAKRDIKPLLAIAKRSRKYGWLKGFDSIALQQSCINLDKAFSNFFKKDLAANYPRFKKKLGRQSSYHCTSIKACDGFIKIPKLAPIKARIHRPIEGQLKSITLTRTPTGKHYASLLIEDGCEKPALIEYIDENKVIGLDMGLTHLAIDSTGSKQSNPRFLKRAAKNLRRKQKALSRKKKGSNGRAKARHLVAKCHEKTTHAREHFQHNLSHQLIDENQAIVVETLKVNNLLKNKKLSKHIADAAWRNLIIKLQYKAAEQGKHVVEIDQWFASSKIHYGCGYKMDSMPLNVRYWDCPNCHENGIDRDINAALNIKQQGVIKLKAEGLSVSANGGLRKTDDLSVAA